ncbi:HNH endonuclease signature motif containing protein [Kitasatospora sp. MAP5-34]|uniref:HNH endonuclease signature motif containing protein n=1 Tax=Kitasatospora sp. MAP5-34 TaxID=3035102 RepID=UPI0024743120|nr:HNH endonuclease signature motif containing protein [Kitasatospora sp. MAP5-34]MDH6577115.1 5-methylcytosine-specific restriction endonuclease McrA [Kitasatospora sp. MAP5-34]
MDDIYEVSHLTEQIARARNWNDLMRNLGVEISGGRRKQLQKAVGRLGLDTGHFKQASPWTKYSDAAIAAAVASSSNLRETAQKLGAVPASGTLSHLRRRIARAEIDVSHFPLMNRPADPELPFTTEELSHAVGAAHSVREVARLLGVATEDSGTRQVIHRAIRSLELDISHFVSYAVLAFDETTLRAAVTESSSFAQVMRRFGLPPNSGNHRKVRSRIHKLGLDTSHFTRRSTDLPPRVPVQRPTIDILRVLPPGSTRLTHPRLRRALEAIGTAYQCRSCGNPGEWMGGPITLQIDHVNGDWLDNRRENLRFLCPNCHACTDTWCGGNRGRSVTQLDASEKGDADALPVQVA